MIKKILIVIGSLTIGGGAERTAAILGNKLNRMIYEVYYLNFFYPSSSIYKVNGIHYCFDKNYFRFRNIKGIKGLFLKFIKLLELRIFVESKIIKDFIKENNIDLIISFMESNNLPVLLSKVLFKNRSKIIVSIRNNPNLTYIKYWANIKSIVNYFLYKLLTIQLLYRKAGKIITVSKGVEISLKEYGIYKNKIKTIHNFYNINTHLKLSKERISQEYSRMFDHRFVFINIGRFHKKKGQEHLIKSFKQVVEHYYNARLIILGEGPLKGKLNQLIKTLNLEEHVVLIDLQTNVFPFLKKSDCFVLTSLWEGFPNVIVEALSMNIPVISTDCEYGPREIICPDLMVSEKITYPYYGKYGILVNSFNSKKFETTSSSEKEDELANTMIRVMDDYNLRLKYSNGLERAYDFDEETIIKQWEDVINHV